MYCVWISKYLHTCPQLHIQSVTRSKNIPVPLSKSTLRVACGKKKNKDTEKDDKDNQPSSSQSLSEQLQDLDIGSKSEPVVSKPEEEEECVGLGLGGSSKKRPRKKKKNTSVPGEQPADSSAVPVEQVSGLTAAGPSQAFPKLSAGRGGGAWKPPPTPQAQVVPIPSIEQQMQGIAQARPGWSASQTISRQQQSQPVATAVAPSSQLEKQIQAPPAWGTSHSQQQQVPQKQQQQQQQQKQQPYPAEVPFQSVTQVQPQFPQAPVLGQPSGSGHGRGRGRGTVQDQSKPLTQPGGRGQTGGKGQIEVKSTRNIVNQKVPPKLPGGIVTRQSSQIRVITNYLEMKFKPLKVYRYDVSIMPERPKKLLPKVFQNVKAKNFPKHIVAFDQRKNCYSSRPLWTTQDERLSSKVELLDDNGSKMSFEVTIKATGIVDLGTILNHMQTGGSSLNPPTEAIQCVDVILQQGTLESYVRVGRQYYMRPRNPIDLFYGMEMWTGLFQSAIFTSRAFINIDVAHKAVPREQSLIDALIKDFRLDPSRPITNQRGIDYFKHFLKGLRVRAKIGGGNKIREYICNDLVDPPNRLKFNVDNPDGTKRECTVERYFQVEKNYRIRYPNLNCLWVGPRDKNIYYPMELLDISYGQAINKQMNDKQLQTMVREAATPPNVRLNKIKEVIEKMNYSRNECFKHFQLDVADKFFQVDAKILPAPRLDIGTGRPVDPRRGVWQANRFLQASVLNAWGLIAIDPDPAACNYQDLLGMIKRVGCQMGMNVTEPLMTNFNVRMHEIHKTFLTAYEKRITMLFVIVPVRDKDAYDKIKRMAELQVGILTQCIKEQTAARRMNDQTVRNILLKVNSKLMGINQSLETRSLPECIKNGGVMMVGADVTHPPPDQKSIPSIAAVTASIDTKCFLYNIELSMQTPKEEIIVDFENMMFDHLKTYRQRQNSLPRKIFVFRDGVSEGQFAQVMNSELVAIHKAYSRLDQRVKPEILFLLVQKRHHTRFFVGENNPQNVEPGTVVDKDIVHPQELDFYLVSHQAIKGTARPTRYHVICNDGNIPSDEVEQLAYYLCHLYSRCTRSVSYPAPTYYAHLACLRARALTS
ncbi:unnamed protein product [Euphydryas editha]|uniref:Argonaute 2 n=1 Tax=Euphydryas editha TaxID=104508 RepID=A0AAU9VDT5_EUPED|nr:unnamed protein product [Euphydryas editha]